MINMMIWLRFVIWENIFYYNINVINRVTDLEPAGGHVGGVPQHAPGHVRERVPQHGWRPPPGQLSPGKLSLSCHTCCHSCLQDSPALLKSDCDEQLILALAFNQVVKIQSIKLRAPAKSGPKTLRVFKNQPRSLDFSQAESFESIQVTLKMSFFSEF